MTAALAISEDSLPTIRASALFIPRSFADFVGRDPSHSDAAAIFIAHLSTSGTLTHSDWCKHRPHTKAYKRMHVNTHIRNARTRTYAMHVHALTHALAFTHSHTPYTSTQPTPVTHTSTPMLQTPSHKLLYMRLQALFTRALAFSKPF
jgi:hypothetical protein